MAKRLKLSTIHRLLLAFLSFASVIAFWHSQTLHEVAKEPISGESPAFYSNESGDDLSKSLLEAIDRAEKSIDLMIYALTDRVVINRLNQKAQGGVQIRIVVDSKTSPGLEQKLSKAIKLERKLSKGIMHLKILVVDDDEVWTGSANFTSESLKMHGNLIIGMKDKSMAAYFSSKFTSLCPPRSNILGNFFGPNPAEFRLGGERVEVWLLPCQNNAVQRIRGLIQSAKKTLRIAMYTWTRYDLANDVIAAKRRGVDVEVKLDRQMANGSSQRIYDLLKQNGVPVTLNSGPELLHYKMAWIDESVLISGSANWTKNAFTVNDDVFMVIYPLTDEQNAKLWRLWKKN